MHGQNHIKIETQLDQYSITDFALFFSVAPQGISALNCLILRSQPHTLVDTHLLWLLWRSDRVDTEAATYITKNQHKTRISTPSSRFEPAIPAIKRLQICASDRTATGIGHLAFYPCINLIYTIRYASLTEQHIGQSCQQTHINIIQLIWCFSDRASQYRLVSNYQLNAHFLYSITIHMLHYNPQHVSSSTMLIFRRTNCIITASGIVTLCKWPYSMPI